MLVVGLIQTYDMIKDKTYKLIDDCDLDQDLLSFIKTLVGFHLRRLNIEIKKTRVEASYNTSHRNKHREKTTNLLVFKCIVFIEDDPRNIIFTNINHDKFKYKSFNGERKIIVCNQQIGTHLFIIGDGFSYVNSDISDINTIDVDVFLNDSDCDADIQLENINEHDECKIKRNDVELLNIKGKLTYSYFNDIFYRNKFGHSFIDETDNVNLIHILTEFCDATDSLKLTTDQLTQCASGCNFYNRFLNKYVYRNFFDALTCNWIHANNVKNSEIILELRNEEYPIFGFLQFSALTLLMPFMSQSYNIDKYDYNIRLIGIALLYVTKDVDTSMYNPIYKGSIFYVDVLLNNNDNSNEYFSFKDGSQYVLNKGDCILYHCDDRLDVNSFKGVFNILRFKFSVTTDEKIVTFY